jgi:hypothetical protein
LAQTDQCVEPIYAIHYTDGGGAYCAFVSAATQRQAVDVLWAAIVADSSPIEPALQEIIVDRVGEMGSVEGLPFPEAVPVEPAVLAVIRIGGGGGRG